MTTEVKRQVLYASLLRYEPAALAMRESAIDRVVLGAMLGSDESSPLRIGAIQENLRFGPVAPSLRTNTIQESLARLMIAGRVDRTEVKKRHAYYLTPAGQDEVRRVVESGADLFDRVLRRMLRDTTAIVSHDTAVGICRAFFCECFARFGRQIAKFVTGQYTKDDLVRAADIGDAFRAAARGCQLSPEARESLETRCLNFVHSTHADDQRLKFYLTHGYYFVQLLGYDVKDFDPLAHEAFRGSILFADTNVLLPALVLNDHNARLFDEVVQVTRKLGIEMRVTRATIDELRRVAQDRANVLRTIIPVVPEELVLRHKDPFVVAYMEARDKDSGLTVDEFMQPFDNLSSELRDRFGIEVDDVTEDEIINGRDVERESQVLQDEAKRTRGWGKSPVTLRHDVAHLRLVADFRERREKAWFLTRDRSVAQAAARLVADDNTPLAFGLLGFLCTMSPFLTQTGDEHSLAAVFSSFLTEQVFPLEQMFDTRDLSVLAEMYDDVFATPPDQLIPALDYVKRHTLNGRPFDTEDLPQVARALRGFLANSADDRARILQAEADRLQQQIQQERAASVSQRTGLQGSLEAKDAELVALRNDLDAIRTATAEQLAERDQRYAAAASELARIRSSRARRSTLFRAFVAIVGIAVGITLFFYDDTLSYIALARYPVFPADAQRWIQAAFRLLGVVMFGASALHFIRCAHWSRERATAAVAILLVVTGTSSRLLDSGQVSIIADVLGLVLLAAPSIVNWLHGHEQARSMERSAEPPESSAEVS